MAFTRDMKASSFKASNASDGTMIRPFRLDIHPPLRVQPAGFWVRFRPRQHTSGEGRPPSPESVADSRADEQHVLGHIDEGLVIHQLANDGERADDVFTQPVESALPAMLGLLQESTRESGFFRLTKRRVNGSRIHRGGDTCAQKSFGLVAGTKLRPLLSQHVRN